MGQHDDNRWCSCCGRQGEIKKDNHLRQFNKKLAGINLSQGCAFQNKVTNLPAHLHQNASLFSTLHDFTHCDNISHDGAFVFSQIC